ncbi:hypothetical protein DVU_2146 [Nitratidesulfovibrio vulgaris str. Hildenborough]|uniref:Uncharacterized protein n=1 Tax=Nitratidesulfovibrio vulgaris (strain ATCC 29579 / DSM 644 / CCUG 34227 / NCIMB 8303 / VKM B-1760 / Hildenborough) TaxID=882 RepID=Q72A51_NITV2|nr:hypothetical protein DVU_2146 [Nitratidesulfovibrio vulgaris str. Hildenborough]
MINMQNSWTDMTIACIKKLVFYAQAFCTIALFHFTSLQLWQIRQIYWRKSD